MLTEEEITHQQELLKTYRRNLALYLRQLALAGEANVSPAVVNGIAEARTNIARIKRILRERGVEVPDQLDDGDTPAGAAGGTTAQPTPPQPKPQAAPIDRTALRQALTDSFSEEDLRDLAFDLGVDYADLPATTRSGKARELITYFERRNRLAELVAAVNRLRPGSG